MGIEPTPIAIKALSPSQLTTRKFTPPPTSASFKIQLAFEEIESVVLYSVSHSVFIFLLPHGVLYLTSLYPMLFPDNQMLKSRIYSG